VVDAGGADAELAPAPATLNFSLGAHARRLKRFGGPGVSIAELARSLYTDRPNLSKIIRAAGRDLSVLTKSFSRRVDRLHQTDVAASRG
jgi:hypothetical protein